jgi:hypothetical protein
MGNFIVTNLVSVSLNTIQLVEVAVKRAFRDTQELLSRIRDEHHHVITLGKTIE